MITLDTKPELQTTNVLLGSHMSIAGGIWTALERGKKINCTTIQLFTKNNNQWLAKPFSEGEIDKFKAETEKSKIAPLVAHDCYLINLASSKKDILEKSRNAFLDELIRCEQLGIPYLNFHPGAHLGIGIDDGLQRIIESLNWAHEQTKNFTVKSVLETTAGQGTNLGFRFEQLRTIIDGVDEPERMKVCIDTCHIFAAGYDIATEEGYEKTMKEFNSVIGFENLVAFHINDSKKGLGSRVDRHEHIGQGMIGELGFRLLMNDKRFAHIPKILETPKSEDMHEDVVNMNLLKSFID
ncbi:MAG: deoxyribonuclease IV [Ignavibacteriales bacterium]|nr:deoxyribonuclease IV [Ignavibacteriales bacterium]